MRLGLVTYNMAKDWDIPTIIEKCVATGFEGVELRTTHTHGVEVTLNAEERKTVKKTFDDSPIELASLGSAFDYHAVDSEVVRQNIEGTKAYVKLAADVGASGVKVRPNGFQEEAGIPKEKTLEQIGLSLRECGEFAKDYGIQIRLEVHGRGTSELPHIRRIIDVADHDNVFVCWNSNMTDTVDGSVAQSFDLVKYRLGGTIHITELCNEAYPWRELFSLLKGIDYQGFCCAEIAGSTDPERVMNYYRALFKAYTA